MADTTVGKIGVDFDVKTGAAKSAMEDMSHATRQATDALGAAGKETRTLGQNVAATKAQQKELTEMTRRVSAALKEDELVTKRHGATSKEAAESKKRLSAAQDDAKLAATAVAQSMERNARAVTELAKDEDGKLLPATKRLAAQVTRMSADFDRATGDVRRLDHQIALAGQAAEKGGKSMSGFMASFAGNVAANAVGHLTDKLREGAMFVVETGAKYETLRIALETTTGSASKAASEFDRLQAFAAKTPFAVEELTESYIKLANRGITPTDRALTSFGNTASAMGKSLDMYVEAVADAITGENERLKEFGIVGKKAGDQVMYTFRGVTTSVKRDAASITEYLTKIGENNFAGGMERQAKSMSGMWSTLKDNAAAFADQLMQGGVADALKDVMAGLIESSGGAESFAKTLGKDLGDAIRGTAELLKMLVSGMKMAADAWHGMSDIVKGSISPIMGAHDTMAKLRGETGLVEQAAIDAMRAVDGNRSSLVDWASQTMLSASAQDHLAAATRVAQYAAEDQARSAAMLAKGQSDRQRTQDAYLADQDAKRRNASRRAMEGELSELMGDKSLSPSEKKRRNALAKELDVNVPKSGGHKKTKDPSKLAMDSMDFDSDVSTFAAGQNKGAREEALKAQEAAFERESEIRQARIDGINEEMELAASHAEQQREQIDMIFWTVDVEGEAEGRRRDLQNERIAREMEMADWQAKNAVTEQQREEARLKRDELSQRKHLANLSRAAADEKKTLAARQVVVSKVADTVRDLAGVTVDAITKAVDGQKGALARGLADYTKDIAIRAGLKSAWHFALAVGSAASLNPVGAAAHATAGAMSAGVAALAAGASFGLGAIASAREGSGDKGGSIPADVTGGSSSGVGKGGGINPSNSDTGKKLDPMDHPITYNDARRGLKGGASAEAPVQVSLHVQNMFGGGGAKQAAQEIQTLLDTHRSAGRRY